MSIPCFSVNSSSTLQTSLIPTTTTVNRHQKLSYLLNTAVIIATIAGGVMLSISLLRPKQPPYCSEGPSVYQGNDLLFMLQTSCGALLNCTYEWTTIGAYGPFHSMGYRLFNTDLLNITQIENYQNCKMEADRSVRSLFIAATVLLSFAGALTLCLAAKKYCPPQAGFFTRAKTGSEETTKQPTTAI